MQAMKTNARLYHRTNMLQKDESYVILYLGRCLPQIFKSHLWESGWQSGS